MTDTDRMGQLQGTAQSLRALTQTNPDDRPPLAEQVENLRSLRTIVTSMGELLRLASVDLGAELLAADGYITRVKNPVAAADQIAAARSVLANVQGAVPAMAGALQVAEVALSRIESVPEVDLFHELDLMSAGDDDD